MTNLPRLGVGARLLALAISVCSLIVLILAAKLTPSPSGLGTHRALGLEDCQFLQRTGLPCPTCGMTTSFAWLMHGHPFQSFYTQPLGMILGVAAIILFWAALYISITGNPVHHLLRLIDWRRWLVPLLGFGILAWAWKIAIYLAAHPHGTS